MAVRRHGNSRHAARVSLQFEHLATCFDVPHAHRPVHGRRHDVAIVRRRANRGYTATVAMEFSDQPKFTTRKCRAFNVGEGEVRLVELAPVEGRAAEVAARQVGVPQVATFDATVRDRGAVQGVPAARHQRHGVGR